MSDRWQLARALARHWARQIRGWIGYVEMVKLGFVSLIARDSFSRICDGLENRHASATP
jgi:hypothetical protein